MPPSCLLCPKLLASRRRIVSALGAPSSLLAIFGEAPGYQDSLQGKPFTGDAGLELDVAFDLAGIRRSDAYLDHCVRCRPPKSRTPSPAELATCKKKWLDRTVLNLGAELIVTLGITATRSIIPELAGKPMEALHGIIFQRKPDGPIYLPMYLPAAGMGDLIKYKWWREDCKVFAATVRAVWHGEKDKVTTDRRTIPLWRLPNGYTANGHYAFIESAAQLQTILNKAPTFRIFLDTEATFTGAPLDIQVATKQGEGWIIPVTNTAAVAVLREFLQRRTTITVVHNALYDLWKFWDCDIWPTAIEDTMAMAYLLGKHQGLKALAMQELRIGMSEYSDVVGAYSQIKELQYLIKVSKTTWDMPKKRAFLNKGRPKVKRVTNIAKRAATILKDFTNKPEGKVDLRDRWKKIELADGRKQVEDALGPIWEADLRDVPLKDRIKYEGMDADIAYRIWEKLYPQVAKTGQLNVFKRDMAALPMVVDMMRRGIRVDTVELARLSQLYETEMFRVLHELEHEYAAPKYFNPGSSPQVKTYLFEQLGMSKIKGDSTDSEVLSKVAHKSPVIAKIIEYRHLAKLKGTYADVLLEMALADPGGEERIHAKFAMTRTTTGRLSCNEPNLMAQPTRTQMGKKIRGAFLP